MTKRRGALASGGRSNQRWSRLVEERNVRQAIYGTIARYTIAVVPRAGAKASSGVCVCFDGERFVATAAHVIESCGPADVDFMVRPPVPLALLESKSEIPLRIHKVKLSRRFPAPIQTITRSSDLEDVALLRLSTVPRNMSHIEFHDMAAYSTPRKIEGGVLVIGFPTELGHPVRVGGTVGTAGFLHIEITNVSNRTLSTDEYNPALHFLVDFARPGPSEHHANAPYGLSGAGVWKVRPLFERALFDARRLRLVGIQSSWSQRKQLLIVTHISRLKRLFPKSRL
jgi:hypothetical protein